jgi:hypothetical protein
MQETGHDYMAAAEGRAKLTFRSVATGAAMLVVERCSLARVQIAVQDGHSAPGLLYLTAVRRRTCSML